MKKRYIFSGAFLLILGVILAILPPKNKSLEYSPTRLLSEIIGNDRYFTADDVAKMIISKDPSIQLIDEIGRAHV